MEIGSRVIYDKISGDIVYILGEKSGDVDERPEVDLGYIDLPYGELDLTKQYIEGVNLETSEVIIKNFEIQETEEQRQIRELEDALLLQAESDVGGIL